MIEFQKSIYIERSPQEVFEVITEPAKSPLWQSFVISAEWTSNGSPGVGSSWKSDGKFLGRNITSENQLTVWGPPNQVSFKSIGGPVAMEITNTLEAEGEGTLLTTSGSVEFGGLFKMAEGLVGKQVEKQMESDHNTLKLLMESNQL